MTNEQIIYDTAVKDGMPPLVAEYLVAQSKNETGNFSHRFFTVGHNGFGYMYDPRSKWQLDRGGPKADNGVPIAQYATLASSVHEITDWIKRRQADGKFPKDLRTIKTPQQYAALLKQSGYYQASLASYSAALVRWMGTVRQWAIENPRKSVAIIAAGAGLIAYGIYLIANRKQL
jgi:hypothetical protein